MSMPAVRGPRSMMRRQPMLVMAAVAELHDVEAGGDIGRAVLAVLQMHRQRAEVGRLAFQHHLLHRRVRRPKPSPACADWRAVR